MTLIPAGKFVRGACNETGNVPCHPGDLAYDAQAAADESPVREIEMTPYYIDTYEVTVDQYRKCVAARACQDSDYSTEFANQACNMGNSYKGRYPMNCITYTGAKHFCEWAGKRLLTSAEWQKAARGGCEIGGDKTVCEAGLDDRIYPWGNETPSCQYCVMDDNKYLTPGCGTDETFEVGSKPAGKSPYGLYDLAGNVGEWVADWYDARYYYPNYPVADYSPAQDPKGPQNATTDFTIPGGGWRGDAFMVRLSARHHEEGDLTLKVAKIGFRCGKDYVEK
jgi:formylglycine-generating enzyme required for sulfatase activity